MLLQLLRTLNILHHVQLVYPFQAGMASVHSSVALWWIEKMLLVVLLAFAALQLKRCKHNSLQTTRSRIRIMFLLIPRRGNCSVPAEKRKY